MDPITALVVVALASAVVDWGSGGLLRAEVGGGARGAARGVWEYQRKQTRKARRKARKQRSKTWHGRIVNWAIDEIARSGRAVRKGWAAGRREARARRAARLAERPAPIRRAVDRARRRVEPATPDAQDGDTHTEDDAHVAAPITTPDVTPEADTAPTSSPPTPTQPAPTAPAVTDGPGPTPLKETHTVADISSAPAAIAAVEAFNGPVENIRSGVDMLNRDLAGVLDNMGDFAIGGESDVIGAFAEAVNGLASASARLDAHIAAMHVEFDASIEAAATKAAAAHRQMQEV